MYFFVFVSVWLFVSTVATYSDDYYDDEINGDDNIQGELPPERSRRWLPPVIDAVREDDHDDFDLADIIAIVSGDVDMDKDVYTHEQRQEFLDLHNMFRSNTTHRIPAASNMEFMYTYDEILEFNAREFLRGCEFKHSFAKNDKYRAMGIGQGQCLYKGFTRSVRPPLQLFHDEWQWYNFNNHTCWEPYPKYQCGHMKAMMWHNTTGLGAAMRSHCFPKDNIILVAVHYLPTGIYNRIIPGFEMYRFGWHCTRCPNNMLCYRNLCIPREKCKELGLDCECKLECQNCAQPDWERCQCQCKAEWDAEDCSYPCTNLKETCEKWTTANCKHWAYKLIHCRNRCGVCKRVRDKDANKTDLCCGGKVCQKYYKLDEETCECKLMCPSELCLFPPSTKRPERRLSGAGVGSSRKLFEERLLLLLSLTAFLAMILA